MVQDITYTLYFQLVIDSIAGIIVLKVNSIKNYKIKNIFLRRAEVLNAECVSPLFFLI